MDFSMLYYGGKMKTMHFPSVTAPKKSKKCDKIYEKMIDKMRILGRKLLKKTSHIRAGNMIKLKENFDFLLKMCQKLPSIQTQNVENDANSRGANHQLSPWKNMKKMTNRTIFKLL